MDKLLRYISIFSVLLFLSSCKNDKPVYRVNPELDPYLQKFLDCAKERGYNFDLKESGILVKFANLEPPKIGLCTYTTPVTIEIDKEYWLETEKSANCENLREEVVFHELGHGLIPRSHDNSLLPNTEWRSIMCGGETFNDRIWSVNFNGKRKKFYLDELFHVEETYPDWSNTKESFNEEYRNHKIGEYNKANRYESPEFSIIPYEDGTVFRFNGDNMQMVALLESVSMFESFYYEVKLTIDKFGSDGFLGVFAGNNINNDYDLYYFTNKRRMYTFNSKCINVFAEVYAEKYFEFGKENTIGILRYDGDIKLFVNGKMLYDNDFMCAKSNSFGIVVPNGTDVYMHSSALYSDVYQKTSLRCGTDEIKTVANLCKAPLPKRTMAEY